MLDVHPPHKAIGSVSEFFLHLFTITVGLLIAVGIEGLVERHQHSELAEQARSSMTAEIKANAANVSEALQQIATMRAKLQANLAAVGAIQFAPAGTGSAAIKLQIDYGGVVVEETAWRTAQATAVLSYMPYDEASVFSNIYAEAEDFNKSQAPLAEDMAAFTGLIRRYGVGERPVTKEAADAMAERLGIWQGHLFNIRVNAKILQNDQDAFLQHRKAEPLRNISDQ